MTISNPESYIGELVIANTYEKGLQSPYLMIGIVKSYYPDTHPIYEKNRNRPLFIIEWYYQDGRMATATSYTEEDVLYFINKLSIFKGEKQNNKR